MNLNLDKNQKSKIAIIGGTGLLGSNLVKLYSKKYDVKAFSREQSCNIDILKNITIDFRYLKIELSKYFEQWKPNIIINTVAVVNLQYCEEHYNEALSINSDIAVIVAKISKKFNAYFIHISTDHYFNDTKQRHTEDDNSFLLNNYAKTKYKAEKEVLKVNNNSLIVRTNIIGFRQRTAKSFFEWLLYSLQNRESIELYTNFFTSPIGVRELGNILLLCNEKKLYGTYNISSKDIISKYDFGIRTSKKFNLTYGSIRKSVLDNQKKIKRALTLGLDVSKIENDLNISMPTINETLDNLYQEYKEELESK
jgi:dTDP-4-dehydrorhamnose reductase